jgi:hypothetical protein
LDDNLLKDLMLFLQKFSKFPSSSESFVALETVTGRLFDIYVFSISDIKNKNLNNWRSYFR